MNFKELFEGTAPKLPGAPRGVSIMTPQQFVAKSAEGEEPESEEGVEEAWSQKYKRSINCSHPKGFSQKAHCAGKKKYNESVQMEMTCPDCGMCKTHGNYSRKSLDEACWKGHHKEGMKTMFGKRYPNCVKNKNESLETYVRKGECPGCGDVMVAEDQIKEKQDACYHKVKSRYKVWPSAYASGALVQCRKKGAANWGNSNESITQEEYDQLDENLKKWFSDKWVRFGPDGKIRGDCARGDDSEGKPKCLPQSKAHSLGKKGRASAAARKRREDPNPDRSGKAINVNTKKKNNEGVEEGEDQLARIRKLSGLDEATKLPASSREFGSDEFQDYMKRIVGTPDIDKKTGQVKTDKKGNEKYVSGKTKTDKYKLPYIHRSSVIEYLGPDGQTYDEDKVKQSLAQRPKALLKQNEKMKHSNGELEQFFNVGFAALTGIALDEDTNKLIIVNTCPGAGSCKVDCFAMKGGKVQFKAAWQSDGRILTYLLNDPDGFFNQLSAEIAKEEKLGDKGGYEVTIRWHDAGDFFSPEYLDMALKMAAQHPGVKFYAYTKIADAALAKKPANFIINWSEGAHTSQEKQVKAQDPSLEKTKNSRIVPDELFQDLLVKDEKKNLVKGPDGQWQVQPDKLPELKQRLSREYSLSANSILSYAEYMAKRKSIPAGMKYNVIVAPGEGDISANDPGVLSTLLLKH